jgi:CDP-diacylglycerol--glycerol-3-phosphate 3-phosphatidyltransferase
MNLPTLLTSVRLAMGPAIGALILWAASELYRDRLLAGFIFALCFILFALAAATDWLDGYLARRLNAVTPLGAALDHTADKVLIGCILLTLAYAALPLHLVIAALIILARDLTLAGLREGLAASGKAIPVGELGKWKAAAQMAGISAFLAFQSGAILFGPEALVQGLSWAASLLLWIAAALSLISAAIYASALATRA